MTYEEAVAVLGADEMRAFLDELGPPPPLSAEQIRLLVGLLGDPAPATDAA